MTRSSSAAARRQTPPPETVQPPMTEANDDGKAPTTKGKLQTLLWNRESNWQAQAIRHKNGSVGGLVLLKPGWNFIDYKLWLHLMGVLDHAGKFVASAEARNPNEDVVRLTKTKIPHARSPEERWEKAGQYHLVVGKVVDATNPLRTLDIDEALLFVEETLVVATLDMLEAQEERAEILRAIREKRESIEKPKAQARADKERAKANVES